MDPDRELTPKWEPTPGSTPVASIPQKRALDEVHTPSIPSPLNPESKPPAPDARPAKAPATEDAPPAATRDKPVRAKKESLKKREAKGRGPETASGRATPDPGAKELPSTSSPLRYKLAPPKPSDFERPKGPVFTPHHRVPGAGGEEIQFYETSEHVYNKKNYYYAHCVADPAFPSSIYRQTESDPDTARMSFEDAATHMYFDKTGRHVTTDKGFRMARANVAIREGRWYWECRVTRGIVKGDKEKGEGTTSNGHVRVGFSRREASLDAPVGYDAYSYGIRDKEGHKVHMSRPKTLFPPGEDLCEGDVIGLEINLPSEQLQRKIMAGDYNPAVDDPHAPPDRWAPAPNIVRDRIPIRFKSHLYFEMIEYHTTKELEDLMNPSPAVTASPVPPGPNHPVPALRTLPGSYVKVYKNGVEMGTAFEDLLAFLPLASRPQAQQPGSREGLDDGMLGYYPSVSVFRNGAAEVNFGPKFWYPPPGLEDGSRGKPEPGALRPVSNRYVEQVIDDALYDIVDEINIWLQKGAEDERKRGGAESVGLAPGQEEIKELVQDD